MATEKKITELDGFFNEFVKLPDLILKGMLNSSTDEDLKNGIRAYAIPLQQQFSGISEYILDISTRESAQNNMEANKLVKMASGPSLVSSAGSISKNMKSVFSKLSLNSIVKEIKKVIVFLLDLFKAPPWVYKILLIIDQILNAIFGWDLPDEMSELLSLLEQNYYKELAAQNMFINTLNREEKES